MKKLTFILIALLSCIQNISAQTEPYYIVQESVFCDGAILCVEPNSEEIGLIEWTVFQFAGNVIFEQVDTIGQCVEIWGLAPGTYTAQAFLYDHDGMPIFIFGPNGNTLQYLETDFYIQETPFIEIYSNAMDFCPASPSFGCDKVCEFTTVTYYATDWNSTGQVGLYEWNVTGAESWQLNGLDELVVNWGSAGTGQVDVFFEDWGGCANSASKCVEILASPEAEFNTMPGVENGVLTVCQGQEVSFENESLGAIYYDWNFGDGGTSIEANPEHVFSNIGTFEVKLIAKNECLCTDTSRLEVIVEQNLTPIIDCVGTICKLDTVSYTSDADCTQFFWTVSSNGVIVGGGGTSDNFVSIDWQGGPVGNIELSVDNCNGIYCVEPALAQVPIITGDAKIEGPENVCKGSTEVYTIQDYNATYYNWSVSSGQIISGQGTNEVIVEWSSPGNVPGMAEISVDYENCYFECTGADSKQIRIVDEFLGVGPIEVCPESIEEYTTLEVGGIGKVMSNWTLKDKDDVVVWSFNNTETVNIPFPSEVGAYMLIIEPINANDYCNDFVEMIINIIERPVPPTGILGELAICPGSSYQYEASTTLSDASFNWYVNNGGVIEEFEGNPIAVTWASTGPYELMVSQTLYDRLPCESERFTQSINTITGVSLAGNNEVCDQEIHSYVADFIENASYTWTISPSDMGVITTEEDKNEIEIQWSKVGTAQLTVDLCGFSESREIKINALPEPVVAGPSELCANETGSFTTNSNYNDYRWYNEDLVLVSSADAPDLFPGSYELVVTDDNGCTGNTYFTVETLPIPNIRISTPDATGICLAINDPFPLLYALDSDVGYSWQWYMDGTLMAGETNATLDVKAVGIYHVEVTALNGCKNISNTLVVFDWCDPNGGGVCNGGNCNLDYCENPNGVLDFTFVQAGQCNEWDFTNTSVNYETGSLEWNFGDEAVFNDVSTLDNPSYTFTNAGFYHVLLTGRVEDGDNLGSYCDIWRSKVVTVPAAAKFDLDTGCPGEITKFYDNSTFIPGEDIVSWSWDFGDPLSGANNISNDQDPTHIYTEVGSYVVSLEIATASCVSRYIQEITVYPKPEVTIIEPDVLCANTSIEFDGLTSDPIVKWSWDFGDPASGDLNVASVKRAFHSFSTSGSYTVSLTTTNVYGCQETEQIIVEIENNGLNGPIISDQPNPMCDGETAMLTAPSGGVEWLWSTGAITESINITSSDVYNVTITDVNGCMYTPLEYTQELLPKPTSTIRAVSVNEYGQPLMYTYGTYSVCEGEDVYLEVIEKENYSYQWSTSESGSTIEFSEDRGNQLEAGTYEYTVQLTDTNTGCSNTIGPIEIIVNPVPLNVTIVSTPSGYLCGGSNVELEVSSPNNNFTYYWNTGVIGTSTSVSMAGDYYVVAVNQFGCEAESNTIEVNAGPDIGLIPNGCFERCGPDTLCLPNIPNVVSFQWYYEGQQATGPTAMSSDFIIEQSGSYYVEMIDASGCMTTSEEFTVTLIDPIGNIDGVVYLDVNENGILDSGDTPIEGAQVFLSNGSLGDVDSLITNTNGEIIFEEVPSVLYDVSVDVSTLPLGVEPYTNPVGAELLGCDAEVSFEILCQKVCITVQRDTLIEFCHGTNSFEGILIDQDTSFVQTLQTFEGCDSIVNVSAVVYDELQLDFTEGLSCYEANSGSLSIESLSGGKGAYEIFIDGQVIVDPSNELYEVGMHTIEIRDELGCLLTDEFEIVELDEIVAEVNSSPSCFNADTGTVSLSSTVGGQGTYSYELNNQSITDFSTLSLSAGTYNLLVSDALGCSAEVEFEIEEIGPIDFNVTVPELACDETEDLIEVEILSSNVDISWNDGSTDKILTVTQPGTYNFMLENDCQILEEQIRVESEDLENGGFYVPNIFSPNADGSNDEFYFMTNPAAQFEDSQLKILDRWGGLVYSTDDPTAPWDGRFKNKDLLPGVYVVMFNGVLNYCHSSVEHEVHKELTIVK